ncbi:MAG: hypothetical protein KGJ23_06460 [Euryarchaeota archaeon]|nr:hypothetical protein [Euryarchaeota archaeon]MDE2044996.1 hypothetical protein [Thermoplasmata archaeon]
MQGAAGPGGGPSGDKPQLFKPEHKEEIEEKEGPYVHLPRHGAAWMLVIGALMMFISLVAPWWSWSMSSTSQSSGLYLFVWGVACFGYSCAGYSSTPLNAPTNPTMQAGNFLPNLGVLYGTVATMAIIAAIFALVAAAMIFRVARGYSTYPKAIDRAVLLSYLAVAISLSTPVMLAVAQTSSFHADYSFPNAMNPNPGNSFYGSSGPATYGGIQYTTMQWGPSWGWFLSIFGGVFFFSGGFVPHLTRHEAVTRVDLIRQGLLKIRAPLRRVLPPPMRTPGLPAPMAVGAPGRVLPPPMRPGMPSGYGYPGYQSLSPGVGWARAPPPAMAPGYRPAALPPPARPVPPPAPVSTANAPGFVGRAAVAPRVAPSSGPARVCPKCLIQVPPPAARCTKCGSWL